MKKILSLLLLCATVMFTSCKDDDNDTQGEDTPGGTPEAPADLNFRLYGQKNKRLAYYDGKEIKYLTEENKYVSFGGVVDNDVYGLTTDAKLFYKNGEVASKEGKIPSNVSSVKDFQIIAGNFYVAGYDKDNDDKSTIWKNGEKLFSSDKSAVITKFCVLGNDILWITSYYQANNLYTQFYKNDTQLPTTTNTNVSGLQVYNGKVYILTEYDGNFKRYIYDGTSADITEDITLADTRSAFFKNSGNSLYTALWENNVLNFYKNLDWTTPLSALTQPAETQEVSRIVDMIEQGSDLYTYAQLLKQQKNKYEAYVWKNSADPIRLPMDTVNVVCQIK